MRARTRPRRRPGPPPGARPARRRPPTRPDPARRGRPAARSPRPAAPRAPPASRPRSARSASSTPARCWRSSVSSLATDAWLRAAVAWRSRAGSGGAPRAPGRPVARVLLGRAIRRSARSRRWRCLRTPAASSMIAAGPRPRVQDGVELALPMIMCCWRPTPVSLQKLLDVEEPARGAVDGVLALPGAEHVRVIAPRPCRGELARRVVDGERHLGRPSGGLVELPAKMDVGHGGPTARIGSLGAEHPGDRVDDVDIAVPFGPTTTVIPGSNSNTVGSAKDLKPFMPRDRRTSGRTLPISEHRPTDVAGPAGRSNQTGKCSAVEGGPAARLRPDDGVGGSAGRAGLPVIDLVLALGSRRPRRTGRGTARRPATSRGLDGLRQVSTMARYKAPGLGRGQAVGQPVVAEPRGEQDLVGVQVCRCRPANCWSMSSAFRPPWRPAFMIANRSSS